MCKRKEDRIKLRAIRIDDELWEAAKAAAATNGEPVSAAVRRDLRRYVRSTERKLRDQQGGQQGPP